MKAWREGGARSERRRQPTAAGRKRLPQGVRRKKWCTSPTDTKSIKSLSGTSRASKVRELIEPKMRKNGKGSQKEENNEGANWRATVWVEPLSVSNSPALDRFCIDRFCVFAISSFASWLFALRLFVVRSPKYASRR